MTTQETIAEAAGEARVVARSDVVVVGGGPAGFAAAIAAKREGCSVTLVERYPYLGGLASGGMVLVLDDMHNGDETTVTGICMEMIERMGRMARQRILDGYTERDVMDAVKGLYSRSLSP